MIFITLNEEINSPSYKLVIRNLDCCYNHWVNANKLNSYFSEIETIAYDKASFDNNLAQLAVKIIKENPRLQDAKFYSIPEENKLILLCISDVRDFNKNEIFTKEAAANFTRTKLAFSIVEILEKDGKALEKGAITVPSNWVFEEKLTSKLNKYRYFV